MNNDAAKILTYKPQSGKNGIRVRCQDKTLLSDSQAEEKEGDKKKGRNNGWSRMPLQKLSLLKISNGIFNDPKKVGKGCKLVNVVNLYTEPYIDTKYLNLLEISQSEFKKFKLQVGDLLFTRSSLKLEGIAHCNMYISRNVKAVFECHTMRIRPNEKMVIPRYLYHYCRSNDARRYFMKKAQTTTMTTISQGDLASLPVFLPPLSEQKAIVSILETWDTAIEKTERLIAAKEKHFKWLLKTLISDQQDNPDWGKVCIRDICFLTKGKGLSKEAIKNTGKNKCILYGQLYTTYQEIINKVVSSTEFNDSPVSQAGDILMPGSTTTSGIDLANATALLESGILLGGDINILRAKETGIYCASFLAYYLTHVKKHEIARYTQGITIVHLYGNDIKRITLSLPKLSRQKQITNSFNMAKKEITTLQNLAEKYRTQKHGLMQKLLTNNMKGENDD